MCSQNEMLMMEGGQGHHGKSVGPRIRVKIFSANQRRQCLSGTFHGSQNSTPSITLRAWKAGEEDPRYEIGEPPGFRLLREAIMQIAQSGIDG